MENKKVNRKVQEEPHAEAAAIPRHQVKRKMTQINVRVVNKQMHDKNKKTTQARLSKC